MRRRGNNWGYPPRREWAFIRVSTGCLLLDDSDLYLVRLSPRRWSICREGEVPVVLAEGLTLRRAKSMVVRISKGLEVEGWT